MLSLRFRSDVGETGPSGILLRPVIQISKCLDSKYNITNISTKELRTCFIHYNAEFELQKKEDGKKTSTDGILEEDLMDENCVSNCFPWLNMIESFLKSWWKIVSFITFHLNIKLGHMHWFPWLNKLHIFSYHNFESLLKS